MTRPGRLFPYYFPTTVIVVDDNPRFLESLALELPEQLASRSFQAADRALVTVNATPRTPPLYQRCFSHYREANREPTGTQLIHLDLSLIEREISNPDRFRAVSVVVVDYDMPGMNGVEFCRRIEDPHVRKILFTGVADEKVAVEAFNDGLIDRFIIKSAPDALPRLREAISALQERYFAAISETLRSTLMLNAPAFLTDPAFEDFFLRLCETRGFVEYYLVAEPDGFLLLDDLGVLYRLVVIDDAGADAQLAFARAQGAPAEVLADLQARSRIGYFYQSVDEFFDSADYDWDEFLRPASTLVGARPWYWALVDAPPVDIDFDAETSNYRSYLRRLDASRDAA
ncbi:MAG: response regulator [Pseudomonadales bacterium]|jgi:CheY-like chemotaxis protein|nr:response regulator [Pseudomonadales bacterium]